MDEQVLVELAQKGDKKALEMLVQKNYCILKGYLVKMTLNPTIADDLTQETMLKAILNIKKYISKGKFSTWLITIATNLYRDYLRKNKRLSYLSEESRNILNYVDTERAAMNKIEFEKVKSVLEQLPVEKRTVFILKHYLGYSYEEISKIVNCPIGTVRSRLYYCIHEIQRRMKGGNEE